MGFAETFSCLKALPEPEAAALLEQALTEPHEGLQGAAVEHLLGGRGSERLMLLVSHFADLLPPARELLRRQRLRLIGAAEPLLRVGDPTDRPAAFELVGTLGDLSHAPLILAGLQDRSARVRHVAEAALRRWIEEFYSHLLQSKTNKARVSQELVDFFRPQALTVVKEVMNLYDLYPHSVYVRTAIELGDRAYALFLERVLEQPGSAVYQAFITSVCMSHSPEATGLLVRLTADRSTRARDAAEEICGHRHDPSFGHELAAHLQRLEPEALQGLAASMLSAPWWAAALEAPDLSGPEVRLLARTLRLTRLEPAQKLQSLRALRLHPAAEVRAASFEELEQADEEGIDALAREGLQDPDPIVTLAAAQLLVRRGSPGLAGLLAPHVRSTHMELSRLALRVVAEESFKRYLAAFDKLDEPTRQKAAQAISKIDVSLIDHLRSEIESLDPARRLKALRIVEYAHKEDELRPLLMDLLHDPDLKVRSTAIKTLQLAGSAEGIRLLIEALDDPNRRVRANAIEALEAISDVRYVALLKPFLHDPDNRVRANTAKALRRLGVPEAGRTLLDMLKSPDRLMRLSAGWVIGEARAVEFSLALSEQAAVEQDAHVLARLREALVDLQKPPEAE